jgi:hypothetical protein
MHVKIILYNFRSWVVMHTKSEANMASHLLVKGALKTSMEEIWIEEYFDFIYKVVHAKSCNGLILNNLIASYSDK